MEILKCQGIRKIYGTGDNQVTALDGINLSVDKGEFVAIVGSSGSGKSTLLHILGTVDKPTEGSVIIDGTDLSTLTPTQAAIFRRRKVGLVYQFYNLIPTLTVRRNILMPLALDKKKPNQEYFQKIVDTLGIADRLEKKPAEHVVRGRTAESSHCHCAGQFPEIAFGGRAHGEPGPEEFQGDHGYARALQPQPEPDHSADHP